MARPIDGRPVNEVGVDSAMLDVYAYFCYLGDDLDAGGGCECAIEISSCIAWAKFRTKHLSLRTRGSVFEAQVRKAMLNGSEETGHPMLLTCSSSAA